MNPRKEERNKAMLADRKNGMSLKDLREKYGLSFGRISLVLQNQERWDAERGDVK